MIARIVSAVQFAAKRFLTVALGVILFTGLMQHPPAVAASLTTESEMAATQASDNETLDELRAQRREIQSKASRAADTEDKADSFKEVIDDKLNLDEIVEENVIVEDARDAIEDIGKR